MKYTGVDYANAYASGGMKAVRPMLAGLPKKQQDIIEAILTTKNPDALRKRLDALGVDMKKFDPLPALN